MKKLLLKLLIATFLTCTGLFVFTACAPNIPRRDEHTVTITYSHQNACTTKGGSAVQKVTSNGFKAVQILPQIGYKFVSYEVGGNTYFSDVISLEKVTEDTTILVNLDYATEELPIVNIYADAPITSKIDYVDMTFSIENCQGELSNVTGGIRLRGNHTKDFPKKPYRIKFDKKQALFGLEKAKSWVLLADYLDPSTFHNHTALTLAKQSDGLGFTPTSNKVNVYLNGEFMGLYVLCEQIQENAGRMNIEMPEDSNGFIPNYTDLMDYNFFVAMDKSVTEDLDAVLDQTYFYLAEHDRYFELKYPEKESFATEQQFNSFFSQLKTYIDGIMDLTKSGTYDQINNAMDLVSLTDFYLIDSIMMELDHTWKSFNMYYTPQNGKLKFGPVWDYDWTMGVPWVGENGAPNVTYDVDYVNWWKTSPFYEMLEKFTQTNALIKEHYNSCYKANLQTYINNFDSMVSAVSQSLALNNQKWYSSYNHNITNENVKFVKKYLTNRKVALDNLYS